MTQPVACATDRCIDAGWLRSYRACIGLPPRQESGVPPLALQIAAAPLHLAIMADRAFPFRPLGIVHQSQYIRQWSEIDATASIDLLAHTTGAREERRGISFGLVTEARVEQTLVWRSEVRVLSITRKASPALDPQKPLDKIFRSLYRQGWKSRTRSNAR